jgi:hypothetical protein
MISGCSSVSEFDACAFDDLEGRRNNAERPPGLLRITDMGDLAADLLKFTVGRLDKDVGCSENGAHHLEIGKVEHDE